MKIHVTYDHIDNSSIGDCNRCAVATAIRKQVNDCMGVWVDNLIIRWAQYDFADGSMKEREMKTPRSVQRFIAKTDLGIEGEPFNFILK